MIENIKGFLKHIRKKEKDTNSSKDAAKERLHLVLMQDRANVSADFLDLMKQEIIDVIKKYIEIDERAIDVRLTNKQNTDGTTGAPALYANIPIVNIKQEIRVKEEKKQEDKKEEKKVEETKSILGKTKEAIAKRTRGRPKQQTKTKEKPEIKKVKSEKKNEK